MSQLREAPYSTANVGRRVKNACITCKIRKVKCDEGKPHCLRCIRLWGSCEGYIPPKQNKTFKRNQKSHGQKGATATTSGAPALIKPAPIRVVDQAAAITLQKIIRQPPGSMGPAFENAEESYLFGTFLDSTSQMLSGGFDSPVWRYLLPQHAANQPFIRYGLAALAGMGVSIMEVMRLRMAGLAGDEENCLGYSPTYKIAIALYDKCVRHMRSALLKPNYSTRDALLACLIVSCFESFHGHDYTSAMHAQNGLSIFYSWFRRQPQIKALTAPFRSPNPSEIEDDLVAFMPRLDVQVLAFFDSRPLESHANLSSFETRALTYMPSAFLSLSQARSFLDLVSCRTLHFLASMTHSEGNAATALMLQGPTIPFPEALAVPIGVNLFAQCPYQQNGHESEREEFSAEIEAWTHAYTPIYKQLSAGNTSQARGATILLLNAKMLRILLASAFFKSEMEYDILLPEFVAIYTLAASIWRVHTIPSTVGTSYNFELGILAPLFLTATRCRDHNLRQKVINLLYTDFHRENCWDSFGIAFISRWIMGMEEGTDLGIQPTSSPGAATARDIRSSIKKDLGITTMDIYGKSPAVTFFDIYSSMRGGGYMKNQTEGSANVPTIPEGRRIRITRFNVDLNMRRAQLEYVQGVLAKTREGLGLKQHIVRW